MWLLHSGGWPGHPSQFPLEFIPVAVLPGRRASGKQPQESPYLHQRVQGSVTGQAQVCAWDTVADGGRQMQMGMQNSWWLPRACANVIELWEA